MTCTAYGVLHATVIAIDAGRSSDMTRIDRTPLNTSTELASEPSTRAGAQPSVLPLDSMEPVRVAVDQGGFPNPLEGLPRPTQPNTNRAVPQWQEDAWINGATAYYAWPAGRPDVHPRELLRNYIRRGGDIELSRAQALELIRGIRLPEDVIQRLRHMQAGESFDVDLQMPSLARYSGTLGNYTQRLEGRFLMTENGWRFEGSLSYRDRYDFNAAEHRDAQQERDVEFARENIPGRPFDIVAPEIPIRMNPYGINYTNEAGESVSYIEFDPPLFPPTPGPGQILIP